MTEQILSSRYMNELQQDPRFEAYKEALENETLGKRSKYSDYSSTIKKIFDLNKELLSDARKRAGIASRAELIIKPPYVGGESGSFQFGAVHGDVLQQPISENGSAHSLAIVDHSDAATVSVCAINIPATEGTRVEDLELTITHDMFSWATRNPHPVVSYRVWIEGGASRGNNGFPVEGFTYPCPWGGYNGLDDPNTYLTPVFPSGSYGPYPYWNTYWWGSFVKTIPGDQNDSSTTETYGAHVRAGTYWRGGVRLWVCAKVIGGNPKHSGGGVRVIATIDQIRLVEV